MDESGIWMVRIAKRLALLPGKEGMVWIECKLCGNRELFIDYECMSEFIRNKGTCQCGREMFRDGFCKKGSIKQGELLVWNLNSVG